MATLLDDFDRTLIKIVSEHPDGIQLYELCDITDCTAAKTRYRVIDLATRGCFRLERGRCKLTIYPVV